MKLLGLFGLCLIISDILSFTFAADDGPCEIARKNGFSCETINVTTTDGYILGTQRITSKATTKSKLKPVLFGHGLGQKPKSWVESRKSTACQMLDKGHEVWLLNLRGDDYGLGHTNKLKGPSTKDFWNFSLNEYGEKDVPAVVDKMIAITGHKSVCYVGASMGSMYALIALSKVPEMNKKIDKAFLLCPSVLLSKSGLVFKLFLSGMFGLGGIALDLFSKPNIGAVSKGVVKHYYQIIDDKTGKYREYSTDGKPGAEFPLYKITTKCYLIYGQADDGASQEMTEALAFMMTGTNANVNQVSIKNYGHLDFTKDTQEVTDIMLDNCS